MNRPEIYKRSIDVLSRAYLEGTLEHHNGCGCAVGNLIAAANNYKIIPNPHNKEGECRAFLWEGQPYPEHGWLRLTPPFNDLDNLKAIQEVLATGYNLDEITEIESAFETYMDIQDEDGYLGLMAVVDVLDRIHEVNDPEITEQSKARFIKVPA